MMRKERLHIGLMIHHLENEYATELLRGAMVAAEELDINLILLPGRGINAVEDDEKYSIYDYQYNVIYRYVSKSNLDALIVSAGTIGSYISQKEMLRFLRGYEDLPILTMEVEYPGYPCVHFNANGMKLAVDHLIDDCGCRKIGYVSGTIGNADAMERLQCYRIALEDHHIPYDRTKVVYGNFSESSEEVVRMLLDAHPDLEAIAFANDKMCIGAYHVFQERGLTVGKDILVTGFDDSEIATRLKPMLTTVRTNVDEMGYRSVCAAYEMIRTGKTSSISLEAKLIVRESCGSAPEEKVIAEHLRQIAIERDAVQIVNAIFQKYIGDVENLKKVKFIQMIYSLMQDEFDDIFRGRPLDIEQYTKKIQTIFRETDSIHISLLILKKILLYAKEIAISLCGKGTPVHLSIEEVYNIFFDHLLDYSVRQEGIQHTNLVYSNFLISNINKDMMINSHDEDKSFFSIVNNLYRVNFKSSFIYTFPVPVIHYQYEKWNVPDQLFLKAYHIGENLKMVEPPEQQVSIYDCIHNFHTPKNRRFTFVLVPLFSNEEQYGLFVCELDLQYFSQIYSVTPQICTAIRLTRLIREMEGDLEEARYDNHKLEEISASDELTGVYNRRGFYRYANTLLERPESLNQIGILLLADLDNLKVINDTFGHDEGDHALKTCIDYLKASTPKLDCIGRIGGDEFAAFAILHAEEEVTEIYRSIKEAAKAYNLTSNKPYHITVSIGIHTFVCAPGKKLQSYVKAADEILYEDKKKKNRVVIKSQQTNTPT